MIWQPRKRILQRPKKAEDMMRQERDAMLLVRAELCDRVETLSSLSRRLSPRDFTAQVETIRALAAAYGLTAAVRLAEALARAVAESAPRSLATCPTALYLTRLQDAIGCDSLDDSASQAMIASVSVRLGV
jgi:hypothetical protein